jgi:hypothetical protein
MVSSPLTIVAPSAATVMSVEVKRSCGCFAASKNSGDCRCAARSGSLTTTLETSTQPSIARRSSTSTRVAS